MKDKFKVNAKVNCYTKFTLDGVEYSAPILIIDTIPYLIFAKEEVVKFPSDLLVWMFNINTQGFARVKNPQYNFILGLRHLYNNKTNYIMSSKVTDLSIKDD